MNAFAEPKATTSRWLILALIHVCMMAFAVTFQMIPPILDHLVRDTGLSYSGAGLLMSLFTLPGVFLALPGGHLGDRFGTRGITLTALVFMTAGTWLMVPALPVFLYGGRLIAGMGVAVLAVMSPQIIASRFSGRDLGLAMGIFNTAVPSGTVLALNLFGPVGRTMGTRWVLGAAAAFCLAVTILAITVLDAGPSVDEKDRSGILRGLAGMSRVVWATTAAWTLFNISILSFFTYGIDFFTSVGYPAAWAGLLASLPMLISVPLAPVAGLVMDRTGWRAGMIVFGSTMCAASVYLLYRFPGLSPLWVVVLGAGVSTIPPACFTLVAEGSPRAVGLGYGLMATVFNAGVFLGIPWMGALRDRSGDYAGSFLTMAVIFLAGAAAAMLGRYDIKTIS